MQATWSVHASPSCSGRSERARPEVLAQRLLVAELDEPVDDGVEERDAAERAVAGAESAGCSERRGEISGSRSPSGNVAVLMVGA